VLISLQIWDVRTGSTFDTIRYDHAVTAVQFDSRKIVAATGENGVKVHTSSVYAYPTTDIRGQIYNRTSMQHSTLLTNGHTSPVERLRYIDRYLVTGGRDSVVKVWAL
jgi:division protein 1